MTEHSTAPAPGHESIGLGLVSAPEAGADQVAFPAPCSPPVKPDPGATRPAGGYPFRGHRTLAEMGGA